MKTGETTQKLTIEHLIAAMECRSTGSSGEELIAGLGGVFWIGCTYP